MSVCAALAGAALFACLADDPACLPVEHRKWRDDLRGIAEQESALRPHAIRDERTGESLFPATHAEAVRIATERDAQGRTLGLGLMQITHRSNWARHGLTIATALDPCASLRAGAAHYDRDVRAAAMSRYNSGRLDGAPGYAAAVMRRVAARRGEGAFSRPVAPAPVPAPPPPQGGTLFQRAGDAPAVTPGRDGADRLFSRHKG